MKSSRYLLMFGGRISGLSSAWYLQQQALQQGVPVRYTIPESSPR